MDYSKTVQLPKTDFPMKADLPKREPEWLKRWDSEQVYQKALAQRADQKGKKQFILHDGPPYANGHLHLGHALNKILKDIIIRTKTMAGYYAPYVPGWDCHGLPIELQLMKELKVTDKHKVDRTQFRAQAKDFAQKFVAIQRQEFQRMGILGDWDHPYLTMDETYKKKIVETFLELQKKGYVFRGKKPVYWCSTDETALAEAEVEYENDKGPSIFVAFPAVKFPHLEDSNSGKHSDAWLDSSFVIWTTTPWTLPANVAIAFNPTERYVLYLNKDTHKRYVMAEKLSANFQKATGMDLEFVDHLEGSALSGARAHHPWIERTVPLLAAGFVAIDTGTGLVHIAPGHGREDYVLGMAHKLEVLSPVDDRGRLQDPGQSWDGVHVFKANGMILDFLQAQGSLLYRGEIEHSYPHCWRCHKPVIFRATDQWFLNIDHEGLRERILSTLKNVKFFPEFGRNRITGMIESRPDWCLSRQRLWGTEIPQGEVGDHPLPDPDIFDVWFESGVSWSAVLLARPELAYPADMYLEGSDQHRGWFQVSLIPSVALKDQSPFKSLLTHGFVMDGAGRPMSKSLGNVIAPEQIINQYGADVLRLWVASSDYSGDVRLSPEILKGAADAYRKVRNTLRYLLNNLFDFDLATHAVPYDQLREIDRWVLHRLQEETQDALSAYEHFEFHRAVLNLVTFCNNELSSFYLDVAKDRLYCDGADSLSRRAAQTTLYHIADTLIRLLAPVLSFTADESWRFMGKKGSVALADFPTIKTEFIDATLADRWTELLALREAVVAEIEKARAAGVLKAPREAHIQVHLEDSASVTRYQAYGAELAAIFSVSQMQVEPASANAHPWTITVLKADGAKCGRCWIFKNDIGADSRWPEVCKRCADVLAETVPV